MIRSQQSLHPSSGSATVLGFALATLVFSLPTLAHAQTEAGKPDELAVRIPRFFQIAERQYEFLLNSARGDTNIPRTFEGKLKTVPPRDWTSGFIPGSLWLLYEFTGREPWKTAALDYTRRIESIKDYRGSHDVGFMLNCSFGNAWRLTRDEAHRAVLIQGARTLSTRFNPTVGAIRSWDFGTWKFPVIIDNMMNLELLCLASRETGDEQFRSVAIRHADTTLKHHFRADASSWHVVDYSPTNGAVLKKQTHQGASDSSAWARGQAWALYGYTLMHRETANTNYLNQALKIAGFIRQHPRLPGDKIPYWDFDAPNIPNEPRDASAAAIMASALIELSQAAPPPERGPLLQLARQQLLALASSAYLAAPGSNGGFLLQHCVGHRPKNSEVDVPVNYADYYFLEALLRYHNLAVKGKLAPLGNASKP
jgi:hypothetical protein